MSLFSMDVSLSSVGDHEQYMAMNPGKESHQPWWKWLMIRVRMNLYLQAHPIYTSACLTRDKKFV